MERIECWKCGKKPYIRDRRIEEHSYTRTTYTTGHRIASKTRVVCEYSNKPWPMHGGTFAVTQRDTNGIATEWKATCDCGEMWRGPDYPAVESQWAAHIEQAPAATTPEQKASVL